MKCYVEITLLPSDDLGIYFLWQKVYQQLHLALVELSGGKKNDIGCSFPEYSKGQPRLGRKVRVFSTNEEELNQLNLTKWLEQLIDYCHISKIRQVPEQCEYVTFSRVHVKTNPERLARRRSKRHGESFEQALAYFEGFDYEYSRLPFIKLKSLSQQKKGEHNELRLFIEQAKTFEAKSGSFNCYGLSKTATVPWF